MRNLWLFPFALALALVGAAGAETQTQELAATSGETLSIELDSGGDVEVVGWDRAGAVVTTRIEGRDAASAEVDVSRTGGGIRVFSPRSRGKRFNLLVKIQVPRAYDVNLQTAGGDVKLEGLEGVFDGKTMGGDVILASLEGEAEISTMGGDISVRASTLDGSVSTMGGDVELDDVAGNLDASTMGGDITERNVRRTGGRDAKAVKVSSHGGDVEVDTAPAGANVKTMGGDIEVRSVDQFLTAVTMGGDVTVERATGDTEITTMGGDIEVGSFDGAIKAETMGGDIEVNVVSSSAASNGHDVHLDSKGGDLRLMLPAGFSGRFEIELVKMRRHADKARIDSDFPLDIREPAEWTSGGRASKYGGDHKIITATGSTGGGDHLVKLKTISGVIRIARQ